MPHPILNRTTAEILPQVVAWRRDLHQHPELGMQEVRTAKIIADHLRSLGMEVQTGIAGTGVVGILKGAKPGRLSRCGRLAMSSCRYIGWRSIFS